MKLIGYGLLASLVVLALAIVPAEAGPLVNNGDFSAGNTGFTSTATYRATGTLLFNEYTVRTDASTGNGAWCVGDHTTGTGNMLIVDSAAGAVWSQTVTLDPGTYAFSAWVNNLICVAQNLADPSLELRAGGVTVAGPVILPENGGVWLELSSSFSVSATGPITLEVWSNNASGNGTDFGIDDICVDGSVPVEAASWTAIKAMYP